MVNRPVASAIPRDAEQKVKPQKSLRHPLAGFLTHHLPIFMTISRKWRGEVLKGVMEQTRSASETVLSYAFKMLAPKHRLLKHGFQNTD